MKTLLLSLLALVGCADQSSAPTTQHHYQCSAIATCTGVKTTETLMSGNIQDIWSQEQTWIDDCVQACPDADVKVDAPSTAADSCVMFCSGN